MHTSLFCFVALAIVSIVSTVCPAAGAVRKRPPGRWLVLFGCVDKGLTWFVTSVGLSATLLVACSCCLLTLLPLLLPVLE